MTDDGLSDSDDAALFRRAVGPVAPVRHEMVAARRRRPAAVPAQTRADERAVLEEMAQADMPVDGPETGEEIQYRRPGLQDKPFRKLRRGQFAVEAELDLHGMIAETAYAAVSAFLKEARGSGHRCVRIIHGKGRGSAHGKPVLKSRLGRWLRRNDAVLAFCSARPVDGGTGAVYVLIRSGG